MKAYLDTNILRQIKKIPETGTIVLVCSQHGILELIAGMTSEKEYHIRKSALINILERNISIIWESISTLQSKAFALNIPDNDVSATKQLMEEIIKTTTLAEANNVKIDLGGNTYSISTLTQHDNTLTDESTSTLSRTLSTPSEERRSLRDNPHTIEDIKNHSEMMIAKFIQNFGIKESTPEYLRVINHYNQSKPLTNYLYGLSNYILNAMASGAPPSKNDGNDIVHLAYSDDVELFISDDKIYKRLQQDFFTVKFLRLDEFISEYFSI
ncbi:hypothetical protein [Pectobacterium parmentieri]|uniref:hypothetical protein n=1 Tax=Pectobacterium parmentieri TaxID=1905730 RepID=UPI0012FB9065|nr:hypothetical protein [Pectobacterium parmentieri]